MSKFRQAINYLEILREAIKLPLITWKLILAIAFFILIPSYLAALAAISLDLPPLFAIKKHSGTTVEVELVREILYWLATTLVASALSKAYVEKPPSILQLFSSLARQWKKIFVTSILTQLIMIFTFSSMLLVLDNPRMAAWLRYTMTIIVISLFLFVHLACQLSIVIASIEESSSGLSAIQSAVHVIRGRKGQSIALVALMFVVEGMVSAAVGIVLQLLWGSVYCVLYLLQIVQNLFVCSHPFIFLHFLISQGLQKLYNCSSSFQFFSLHFCSTISINSSISCAIILRLPHFTCAGKLLGCMNTTETHKRCAVQTIEKPICRYLIENLAEKSKIFFCFSVVVQDSKT